MAVLTDSEYGALKRALYTKGKGKEELKALVGGLPNKTQTKAAFQSLEDNISTAFTSFKSNCESYIGTTLTVSQAKKINAVFIQSIIDQSVSNSFSAWKTGVDTALGITTSTALFEKILQAFLIWKISILEVG